jgi:hypothetical protein
LGVVVKITFKKKKNIWIGDHVDLTAPVGKGQISHPYRILNLDSLVIQPVVKSLY